MRELKGFEAINEGLDLSLAADPRVYLMGLGVPDPKGVFGTTAGLQKKHGASRVMDMPTAENGMTGVAIGSALAGMRPVMVHQRIDFAILAMEQIVNQASKWHYMFGGQDKIPLVIRFIIGRGWGQGSQHAQSLQNWFAHIPGLKVVMPSTPADAKGLLMAAIEDDNPVVYFEHRWLHSVHGPVPEGRHITPLGKAHVARQGSDVTIVAMSYMTIEALRAAEFLARQGVEAEVIDVRTLRPLDEETILASVRKTGRLVVADTAWTFGGFSGEIVALAAERCHGALKAAPRRLGMNPAPMPSTPALANLAYPRAEQLAQAALDCVGKTARWDVPAAPTLDQPDPAFTGPF